MSTFARTDTSVVGRWWWTVDRWTLLAACLLIAVGALLALAASPAVALNRNLDATHFVLRHFAFLVPAVSVMLVVSMLTPRGLRRMAALGLLASLLLVLMTLVIGPMLNGAHRWLQFGGFSLQPSEFAKPLFVVTAAWLFAVRHDDDRIPATLICCGLYGALVGMLLLQPDFGMAIVVTAVWFTQFFLAGLSMLWVAGLIAGAIGVGVVAYFQMPHVMSRIDRYLDPASGDSYQIDRGMEAIAQGGWFGRGPGEGRVKAVLPDAHTDFVFSVAGEEFGLIACLLIVGLFAFITLRGFSKLLREQDLFVLLASAGLLTLFGLQAVINIGVNLHLLPTKGMTLPFISYGGSSLVATGLCMGMLLGLTRRRAGAGDV